MNQELLSKLQEITPEEQAILNGQQDICKDLYTSQNEFIVDSRKLLEKGRLIEIRPHTRFAHFPKHTHNYVEMIYMCSGTTTHIINDTERIHLKEGDILFLNQNTTQEILPASIEDIAINFIILPEFFTRSLSMIEQENVLRDFLISTLSKNESMSNYLYFQAKEILPVQNLIENMIWTIINKSSGMNTINQTTMGLLFMHLSMYTETISQNNPSQYEQNMVFAVLKYIENNYKNGTLSEISFNLNQPTYFVSRLLKKHTGSNFKELLQRRKLQQATYLLSQTTLPIDAIIESIGYDNGSYFYRRFKEKYGSSPNEYRTSFQR